MEPSYQNPTFGTVTSKTNVEDNSAEKILVQNSLGKFNWIYKNSLIPDNYTKVVYVNNNNPNEATIFDLNNPPVTNDNLLKSDVNNLYIGTDASTWVYNATTVNYVTKTVTSNTSNFYLTGTTTDAGNNKTAAIERTGPVGVGTAIASNHAVTKAQHDTKANTLTDVNFGAFINGLTPKITPIDADSISIVDSADSNKQKKVSLTNFKTWIASYFALKDRLLENASVTGSYALDYGSYELWNLTLTGNTTFSESNLEPKTIIIRCTGNFALTFPANWSTDISGIYDGTVQNLIVAQYFKAGVYKVSIIQPY